MEVCSGSCLGFTDCSHNNVTFHNSIQIHYTAVLDNTQQYYKWYTVVINIIQYNTTMMVFIFVFWFFEKIEIKKVKESHEIGWIRA